MADSWIVPLPVTEDDEYWDPTDNIEPNDWLEASYVACPRCKGTGMDRWEEDECQHCFGEGQVLQDLPIPETISHRYARSNISSGQG